MAESAVLFAAAGTAVSSGGLSSGEFRGGDVAESAVLFAAAGTTVGPSDGSPRVRLLADLLGVRIRCAVPAAGTTVGPSDGSPCVRLLADLLGVRIALGSPAEPHCQAFSSVVVPRVPPHLTYLVFS